MPALENRPELEGHLLPYYKIYIHLNRSRDVGFGVGAIKISEIYSYCRLMCINSITEREDVLWAVQVLDTEFLAHQDDKAKKTKAAKENKSGGRNDKNSNRR